MLRHRLELTRERLTDFARDHLTPDDLVAVEATTNTWAVVRLLKPFVAGVVVSNPLKTRAIAEAKVKTDKVDAHVLAQLLRCDFLPGVWQPDEATEGVRRLTARRARLVGQQTAIKNRLHAILAERLIAGPLQDPVLERRGGLVAGPGPGRAGPGDGSRAISACWTRWTGSSRPARPSWPGAATTTRGCGC